MSRVRVICGVCVMLLWTACGADDVNNFDYNNDRTVVMAEDMSANGVDMLIEDLVSMPDLEMQQDMAPDLEEQADLAVTEDDMPGDMPALDMAPDREPDMGLPLPVCDDEACTEIMWSMGPDLPVARDHHMTFLFGDESTGEAMLYVAGGFLQGSPPNFLDAVVGARVNADGSLGAWEEQPALPVSLAGTPVIQRGDTVILPGGRITNGPGGLALSKKIYANTLTTTGLAGPWQEIGELPVNRFHHGSAQNGAAVYLTGGLEINEPTSTVHRAAFNPEGELSAWRTVRSMPEPKTHHGTFVHGSYLYVTGGLSTGLQNPTQVSTIWRASINPLNGDLGPWERHGDFPEPLITHAHTLFEGYVYTFGGITMAGFSDQVWRAKLLEGGDLGEWEVLPDASMPRTVGHTHHVPIWGDHFYVTSGGQRLTLTEQVSIGALNARR